MRSRCTNPACPDYPNECQDGNERGHVYAMGDPDLGLGWRMHLGYVGNVADTGYTGYVSPDGALHELTEGPGYQYSTDNTRLRVLRGTSATTVEFPDGTKHVFAQTVYPPGPKYPNTSPDLGGANFANDGSFIQRRYLTETRDRLDRSVLQVSYTSGSEIGTITLNPGTAAQRQITATWKDFVVNAEPGSGDPTVTWRVLDTLQFPSIVNPAIAPDPAVTTRQTIRFSFVEGKLRRPEYVKAPCSASCKDTKHVLVPLLSSIAMEGSAGESSFQYGFGYQNRSTEDPPLDNGCLTQVTLPTGGKIKYEYGATVTAGAINIEDGWPEPTAPLDQPLEYDEIQRDLDESPGVTRRVEEPAESTNVERETIYKRQYIRNFTQNPVLFKIYRRVLVRTRTSKPSVNPPEYIARRHIFTAGFNGEGGLELERREYVSEYDAYKGETPVLAQPDIARSVVRCYEGDAYLPEVVTSPLQCGYRDANGDLLQTGLITNVRMQRETTFTGKNPTGAYDCAATYPPVAVPCVQQVKGAWSPGAGEYGTETTTVGSVSVGRIVPTGFLSRVQTRTWTPETGSLWFPKKLSASEVSESWAGGACPAEPCTVKKRYCWTSSNLLASLDTFAGTAAMPACTAYPTDREAVSQQLAYEQTPPFPETIPAPFPVTETIQGRPSGSGPTLSAQAYTNERTFDRAGRVLTSKRSGWNWYSFDVTRENGFGLVSSSRDPNLLQTLYVYDAFGRLVRIRPPGGELDTTIAYVPHAPGSLARVLVKRGSASPTSLVDNNTTGTVEAYQYDDFGRIIRRVRKLPNPLATGSRYAVQKVSYDPRGAVSFESEWTPCSSGSDAHDLGPCLSDSPADGTTWSSFDPLGRATVQTLADGSEVTIDFTDSPDSGSGASFPHSEYVQNVTRTVDNDSAATPPRTGTLVTSRSRTDVFGRLIRVFEPSPSGLGSETEYRHNVLGKLGRVDQKDASTTQTRTFAYDAFGFLREETHPEVEGKVKYDLVDALGNVWKQTARTSGGGVLRTWDRTFDGQGRETEVKVDSVQYLLREYDTAATAAACGTSNLPKGKLARSVSWNREVTGQPAVEDVFCYAHGAGRLTKVRDVTEKAEQAYTYSTLGLLATESYPRDYETSGPTLVATTTYRNGLPVGLSFTEGGAATTVVASASYHPTGGLASYVLGGSRGGSLGIMETIQEGFLGRPSRILATTRVGGATVFDTGTITYDRSGNLTRMTGGDLEGPHELRYDGLSRLTEATYRTKYASTAGANVETEAFGYDRYGNLTRRTVDGQTTPVSVSLATNRLTDAGWQYDSYGQVMTEPLPGGSRSVTWDKLLRQARTEEGGGRWLEYLYDARGERRTRRGPTEALVPSAAPTRFHTVAPCRLVDTRYSPDAPVMEDGRPRTFEGWERCGVPRQATALAANLTSVPSVTGAFPPQDNVSIRAVEHHPADEDRGKAIANAVNASGQTRAAQTIVALSAETGRFTLFPTLGSAGPSPGQSHVLVDVAGYFLPEAPGSAMTDFVSYRGAGGQVVREFRLDGAQTLSQGTYTDRLWFGGRLVATKEKGGRMKLVVTDHLGSPRVVTAATEEVLSIHRYGAYGTPRSSAEAERTTRFASMEYDAETSRFYDHARYYTATLGRFTSPDSVNGDPADPRSFNRYTYARNNPLKYVDPDGRAEYPASVLLGRGAPQSAEAAARAARGAPIANVLLRRDFGRRAPLTADGNGTFGVGDRVGVKLDLLRGDVSLSQSGGVGGGPDENRVISYAEKMSLSLSTGEVSMAQGAQVSLGLLTAESYDNGDATVTVQAKKYLAVQVGVNGFNLKSAINSFGETVMALVGNLMEAAGVTPGSPGEPPTKPVCTDPVQGGCR